ncbi:hypothetical protein [Nodularia sp. UHCC 0506]|uniref:hypothetical protein n=1 Tax=Nodularia sp. UHCC 0506 TaxID=3110243 RepID=UPI002B203F3D|nr:hypothetical protein [Nodularia sp. UHCC 0506]MEA5515533.1 hypothetical protein [Nodularia sp. UHCC 0506]
MANEPKSDLWVIPLGGTIGDAGAIQYAFRSKKDAYKNIAGDLGLKKAKDTDKGLIFGANSPKPATVRILYTKDGQSRSATRFCQPDNLNAVTTGGKLNGKKIRVNGKEYNIFNVVIKSN